MERLKAAVHPDDWEGVVGAIDRSAQSAEPVQVEYRIALADGETRWVLSRGRPHFTAAGQPSRLMGVSTDITDRKRGEVALRVSEERLQTAADLAGLAFYELDYGNGVSYVDDRFRSVCGLPADREQGLQPFEFWLEHLHPDDRPRIMDARELLHLGRIERLSEEYRYLHPALGQRWIQHIARAATRDAAGRVLKTFGVFRDVTNRRQAEESLRQSYAEIERLKDRLQAETDYLRAEIGGTLAQGEITGQSGAVKEVLHLVRQVAATDSTVLVRGETGTGKELVAQEIHRLSGRHQRVMVKVNCGALPSGLVESELFGREKGAFTGALTRQVGRFEVADGSTLFLDEVGELPPDVQVKLLRVLQEGEFERLGSPRTVKVNVRVIAATNRDLAEAVRQGRFREDLFYRLNVFPIRVPPLRERAEDIPLLVWTFLEELSSRMGKKITQVPRATMDALVRHPWPGNVRELRNVIEHAVILTSGETLAVPRVGEGAPGAALPQTLTDLERGHILRTLETTGWRIKGPSGAAAALGLNPATLYSRMKKLGIRRTGAASG
jgi:formate hydrogenlyase transcriptional activator